MSKLTDIYKNEEWLVRFANACDLAYCTAEGHPEWHEPLTFGSDGFAEALASLPALINGVCWVADDINEAVAAGNVPPSLDMPMTPEKVIVMLREGVAPGKHVAHLCMMANVAWNAQEPLRDRTEKMNCWYEINIAERAKDEVQVNAGAKVLAEWLNLKGDS
jgi:hypothetical protein